MERYAIKNGNWSDSTVWDGGTLPSAGDDVHAGGFTVDIDQAIEVASIRNDAGSSAPAGGRFEVDVDVTITADVIQGVTLNEILRVGDNSACTVSLFGDVTGGAGSSMRAVRLYDGSSLTITGNVTGGDGSSSYGVYSLGTLAIVGNVTGGSGTSAFGVLGNADYALTVTGNVTGGSGSGAYGIQSTHTASQINVTGDLTADAAAAIDSNGTLIHTGDATSSAAGLIPVRGDCKWLIDATAAILHSYRTNDGGSPGAARLLSTEITPDSPGFATLTYTCYDQNGAIDVGVTVEAEIREIPSGDVGVAYDKATQSVKSDASGIATLTVAKGATYRIRRGCSEWGEYIRIGNDDVQTLESVIGKDS